MKSLVLLAVLSACGDKHAEPVVAEVNALVPASHRTDLDFMMRDVEELLPPWKVKWRIATPKSWEELGTDLVAPHHKGSNDPSSYVGSFISLRTEKCEGECTPPPRLMGKYVMSEHDEDIKVNGRAFHRRVQIWSAQVPGDDGVNINVHTGASAGPVYHECSVRLEPEFQDALKAFESACTLATVN